MKKIFQKIPKDLVNALIASVLVFIAYMVFLVLIGIPATQQRVKDLGEKPGNYLFF